MSRFLTPPRVRKEMTHEEWDRDRHAKSLVRFEHWDDALHPVTGLPWTPEELGGDMEDDFEPVRGEEYQDADLARFVTNLIPFEIDYNRLLHPITRVPYEPEELGGEMEDDPATLHPDEDEDNAPYDYEDDERALREYGFTADPPVAQPETEADILSSDNSSEDDLELPEIVYTPNTPDTEYDISTEDIISSRVNISQSYDSDIDIDNDNFEELEEQNKLTPAAETRLSCSIANTPAEHGISPEPRDLDELFSPSSSFDISFDKDNHHVVDSFNLSWIDKKLRKEQALSTRLKEFASRRFKPLERKLGRSRETSQIVL